ncbi:hypothetical protein EVAR_55046_1 [Eumeta japonica]|uniref:Uncharacterized protein n=1 Tax=Eumeta variegata TaxID=151549 RepID=A0A4C1ZSF4_EUMVA|nr:hypothetical protein EVAR_55046_1 [Eumeta japonica]
MHNSLVLRARQTDHVEWRETQGIRRPSRSAAAAGGGAQHAVSAGGRAGAGRGRRRPSAPTPTRVEPWCASMTRAHDGSCDDSAAAPPRSRQRRPRQHARTTLQRFTLAHTCATV